MANLHFPKKVFDCPCAGKKTEVAHVKLHT